MISFLNKYGEDIGTRDFIEVQWTRRWSECGQFVVYMAAKDYDTDIKYVINSGRPETGIVQKIEYEENSNGEFITLSGYFVEKAADFGALQFNYEYPGKSTGTSKELIESLIEWGLTDPKNKPQAPYMFPYNVYTREIDSSSVFPSSIKGNIDKYTPIGQGVYNMLAETPDYSYHCTPIWAPKNKEKEYPLLGLNFIFKKSKDLTDEVFFGRQFSNVISINYTLDESAEKSYYILLQKIPTLSGWKEFENLQSEWEGNQEVHYGQTHYENADNIPANMGNCKLHKVYETNINNVEITPATESATITQMKQQGNLDMLNNYKIEEIEVQVIQERFLYLKDYDIGDKVTIVVDALHQMYTVRIEEVREVHKNNMIEIELVLGTPRKVKWREIR